MAGCAAKNHARKVGLGETRDTIFTEGGISQGIGKFLQGGGAGDYIVWVRDVGPFGVNGEEGRSDTHGVPSTSHRETSEVVKRQGMGDVGGGRRMGGSGNAVGKDLYRETAGNCGSVGGVTSPI